MMAMKCEERGIPKIRNSRMYEHIRNECLFNFKNEIKPEIRKKLSDSAKIRMKKLIDSGNLNFSGVNTILITDGKKSKRIPKTDSIPIGWYRGRKGSSPSARTKFS
jgi:hypothetical protein